MEQGPVAWFGILHSRYYHSYSFLKLPSSIHFTSSHYFFNISSHLPHLQILMMVQSFTIDEQLTYPSYLQHLIGTKILPYSFICRHEAMRDLITLFGSLQDNKGKILVPGIYDSVAEVTPEEEALYGPIDFCLVRIVIALPS